MGIFPLNSRMVSQLMPASVGEQGPGETTIFSGASLAMSARVI
jgi:hypothetical protein